MEHWERDVKGAGLKEGGLKEGGLKEVGLKEGCSPLRSQETLKLMIAALSGIQKIVVLIEHAGHWECRYIGIHDNNVTINRHRRFTTCPECLPFVLTSSSAH